MEAIIRFFIVSLLFFVFFFSENINGQSDSTKYSYRMIARPTSDSILLRWAPVNYESWRRGIRCGYSVTRYTIYRNGNLLPVKEKHELTRFPLKPWPVEKWEPLADSNDYAGVAAQAIYGTDFTPETENNSSVVSIFNKATEQQNRFSFALFAADVSVTVAKGMALYIADHQVVKGEKYLYVVYPACGDSLKCDTAFVYTGTDEAVPLIKPMFTEMIAGNKTVTLQWKSPEGRWSYTSFEIQRSNDQGKTFAPVNKKPMINTLPDKALSDFNFYIDSLPDNLHTYQYRVRGINPFGEKGPFSDTVSVRGKDQISITPHIVEHVTLPQGVRMKWEIEEAAGKRIRGFKVTRSSNGKKGWQTISGALSSDKRSFLDPRPLSTAYYKIMAWGDNKEISTSFPVLVQLVDSVPPAAPTGLRGEIDTTGIVKIHWRANTEPDIFGYRLYRANAREEEFSQLTVGPISDTLYVDKISLKTLTPHVYYKVMAIDKRQNYSAFSNLLELKRPDIVPPVPPVIQQVYSTSKGVNIVWVHSTSHDMAREYVLRREAGKPKWMFYAELSKLDTLFTDSLGTPMTRYEYALQAKDSSGLCSKIEQRVTGLKLASKPAQPILKAEARKAESTILLHWQPIVGGRYQLYRASDKEHLSIYTTLDSQSRGFTDKNIKPGHIYRYLLKYIGENGVAIGNPVEVKY